MPKQDLKNRKLSAKLEKWLLYWIEKLGLSDWEITYSISNSVDTLKTEGFAEVKLIPTQKVAHLIFLNPDEAQRAFGSQFSDVDYEVAVVHELLHLHIAPIRHQERSLISAEVSSIAEEHAVEAISYCLVSLKNGQEISRSPKEWR